MRSVRLFATVLLGMLLLCGCRSKEPAASAVPASTIPEEPAASAALLKTSRRNPTNELEMVQNGVLQFITVELFEGDGWSIYIPQTGWEYSQEETWDLLPEDRWSSTGEDPAWLCVRTYENMNAEDAYGEFIKDYKAYKFTTSTGAQFQTGFDASSGMNISVYALQKNEESYVLWWQYPQKLSESLGAHLMAIVGTFDLEREETF